MATSVPPVVFGPTGFIAPIEPVVLEAVLADIDAAFGGGLNLALETPQGQLASSQAAIIGQANAIFVYYTNQVDPAFATGRMQDAIARIYFLERNGAQPTVAQATCTGLAGVVIPVGALAIAEDGNIYTCTEAGTIGLGGTVTLSFACNTLGPVACPVGSLNSIYQAIPGWDSITNADDGVIGNETESRVDFEARRAASVALNSRGSLPAVRAAVLDVANVLDAFVTENVLGTTQVIGGFTLAAHSLYVAVVGGLAADIARAIWTRKAPGCNYNGNTTVVVEDSSSGYSPPYPAYSVTFEIPAALPILFKVALANNALVPADAVAQVRAAIIAAFTGADGGVRAQIGSKVYASRYYAPVASLGSWVQIVAIDVGSANTDVADFTASIAATVMTVTAVGAGTLAIGQTITGAGVLPGTKIATFGSGSGGTGTYNLTVTQTVVSSNLHGVLADQNVVITQIDQVPTIAAENIEVTVT